MNTTVRKRPFILTLLCLFTFTYTTVIAILLFITLLYSNLVTGSVNSYLPEGNISPTGMVLFLIAGILLHAAIFAGATMMWFNKSKGFFLLMPAALLLALYPVFAEGIGLLLPTLYIAFIILFGVHFRRNVKETP